MILFVKHQHLVVIGASKRAAWLGAGETVLLSLPVGRVFFCICHEVSEVSSLELTSIANRIFLKSVAQPRTRGMISLAPLCCAELKNKTLKTSKHPVFFPCEFPLEFCTPNISLLCAFTMWIDLRFVFLSVYITKKCILLQFLLREKTRQFFHFFLHGGFHFYVFFLHQTTQEWLGFHPGLGTENDLILLYTSMFFFQLNVFVKSPKTVNERNLHRSVANLTNSFFIKFHILKEWFVSYHPDQVTPNTSLIFGYSSIFFIAVLMPPTCRRTPENARPLFLFSRRWILFCSLKNAVYNESDNSMDIGMGFLPVFFFISLNSLVIVAATNTNKS